MKKVLAIVIIGFGLSACCGCGPACDPSKRTFQNAEEEKQPTVRNTPRETSFYSFWKLPFSTK